MRTADLYQSPKSQGGDSPFGTVVTANITSLLSSLHSLEMAARKREDTITFAPGPAALPTEVLLEAQRDAMNYRGLGIGVMEMSHRTPEFTQLNQQTQDLVRTLLHVPDNYCILFMQGGGTGQFASIPMNITPNSDTTANYFITGQWSNKAAKEAEKYVHVNRVLPESEKYSSIPDADQWTIDPEAAYTYYCANETVHGVEFPFIPECSNTTLVCDCSSSFLTRTMDVSKFGVIYAGAQKNVGCAGVTVTIIREDLLGKARKDTPTVLDYTVMNAHKSAYNTPPVWSIYILNRVLQWIKNNGGVEAMEERSDKKSKLLFDAMKDSCGFYTHVVDSRYRSRVNIPFRITPGGLANEELEKKFLKETAEAGMISLKGYRTVGGLRASLYNAITVEQTALLAVFMREFVQRHKN